MNEFHFLRPEWFWGLPPVLLLLVWLARRQLRSRSWQSVCDPELLPHLLLGRSVRRANWPLWLLLLGLLLSLVALAGPVWKRQPQPLFRQQSALVVLLDLSRSMQAADLKPSRFLRARHKIEDLLRQRKEGQTALVVFADDAFTVTPLTSDRHTIEALLKSLDPGLMPVQGSRPDRAIQHGVQLLQQASLKRGRLLLVTDEDRPEQSLEAARTLAEKGYELAVLGVGTPEGAPIPLAEGGFFKDAQGNLVLPRLNGSGLQQLANAGDGAYHSISIDDADLKGLLAGLEDHRLDQPGMNAKLGGDLWREEGIWLLLPLVLLAACAFRRGWLLVLPFVLLLQPAQAQAISWQNLWQTPDQQAERSFGAKDYAAAAQQFENTRWKAAALYRDGKFAEAAKLLHDAQGSEDFYNQGNALARQGNFPAAIKAYDQALKMNPAHEDAQFNKDLVERELKKQQQKQNQQKQGQEGDKDDQQKSSRDQQDESSQGEKAAGDQKPDQGQSPPKEANKDQAADQGQADEKAQQQSRQEQSGTDKKKDEKQPASGQKAEAQRPSDQKADDESSAAAAGEPPPETDEQRESRLLLQQIPDDPGGLLRRKFLYQYRQRGQQSETDRSW